MTSGPRFLVVTRSMRGTLAFARFHDDPPTKSMLRGAAVVFRCELKGRWYRASLDEIATEFRKRAAEGRLP